MSDKRKCTKKSASRHGQGVMVKRRNEAGARTKSSEQTEATDGRARRASHGRRQRRTGIRQQRLLGGIEGALLHRDGHVDSGALCVRAGRTEIRRDAGDAGQSAVARRSSTNRKQRVQARDSRQTANTAQARRTDERAEQKKFQQQATQMRTAGSEQTSTVVSLPFLCTRSWHRCVPTCKRQPDNL